MTQQELDLFTEETLTLQKQIHKDTEELTKLDNEDLSIAIKLTISYDEEDGKMVVVVNSSKFKFHDDSVIKKVINKMKKEVQDGLDQRNAEVKEKWQVVADNIDLLHPES